MNAPSGIKSSHLLKIIKVGNSLGVILPKDMLAKLGAAKAGDLIDIVDIPDGIAFRPHDDGFAAQMEVAREVMKRRRNALRELAK